MNYRYFSLGYYQQKTELIFVQSAEIDLIIKQNRQLVM